MTMISVYSIFEGDYERILKAVDDNQWLVAKTVGDGWVLLEVPGDAGAAVTLLFETYGIQSSQYVSRSVIEARAYSWAQLKDLEHIVRTLNDPVVPDKEEIEAIESDDRHWAFTFLMRTDNQEQDLLNRLHQFDIPYHIYLDDLA
jgi:hypothetical protein